MKSQNLFVSEKRTITTLNVIGLIGEISIYPRAKVFVTFPAITYKKLVGFW